MKHVNFNVADFRADVERLKKAVSTCTKNSGHCHCPACMSEFRAGTLSEAERKEAFRNCTFLDEVCNTHYNPAMKDKTAEEMYAELSAPSLEELADDHD